MRIHKNDIELLTEAYTSINFKARLNDLTLPQVYNIIETATDYELDIIEEALNFGGIKSLFGAGKQAVKSGAKAVGQAAAGATDTIKGAAQQAGQAIQGAGRAVKAGTQQVGSNINKMYKTGQREGEAEQRRVEVQKLVDSLTKQLEALKQANPNIGREFDDISELTIGEIQRKVQRGFASNVKTASDARKGGFTKGVGAAASRAFNQ